MFFDDEPTEGTTDGGSATPIPADDNGNEGGEETSQGEQM